MENLYHTIFLFTAFTMVKTKVAGEKTLVDVHRCGIKRSPEPISEVKTGKRRRGIV